MDVGRQTMSCEHQHGASGSDGAASEAGHFPARRLPSRLNLFLPFSSAVAEASPYPLASKCAHCNRNLEAGGAEARWGTGLCDESGSLDAALTCPSLGDLYDSRVCGLGRGRCRAHLSPGSALSAPGAQVLRRLREAVLHL